MINLNINEKKSLQFDVSVSGVDMKDLRGSMKIVMNKIQYGFPIAIMDGKISVEIPALSGFLKEEALLEKTVEAKLEIIASDTYLVPWEDNITLESPMKIEAALSSVQTVIEKIMPSIKIKNPIVIEEVKPVKVEEEEIEEVCDKKKKKKSKFAEALEK